MKDLEQINTEHVEADGSLDEIVSPELSVSIRVSPQNYFTALLLGTFFSAFLFYLEMDLAGVILFGVSWILIPFFALADHIKFDGKRLVRTGLVPRVWSWINTSRRSLKINDIEQVETQAIRTMKRGGHLYYRYRTVVRGKGLNVVFASGASGTSEDYRRIIKSMLPKLSDNVLDNRSIELRDHLEDPKETLMRAEFSQIPAADVLESSFKRIGKRVKPSQQKFESLELFEDEKAEDLTSLANELRLSGYLVQALEAFRRALVLKPRDARLIFDFARCLHSFAGMTRDQKLERRALAALRLSERRAADDGELLVRLGEWYFQIGEWRRAGNVFQNALESIGENFRTARGLAEIALRDGKIAHVIHHFSTANRIAETPSLRRWSKAETEYFSNLNSDDEYMEMEVGRVNLLETVERSKKTALKIAFFGFPLIIAGITLEDDLVANIGWAVSTVSLLIWTGLIMSGHLLAQRIPYQMLETDD
ncbi:MAG: tetratricopeptide repeat protein [Chloracidobacterium sp.]|nr:tetratricopeptide repeat protein [Chloracidobacterium sp.]